MKSDLTIVVRQVNDVTRYGTVEFDETGRITAFREKGSMEGSGWINGGTYVIHKDFFLRQALPEKFSLEKDLFEKIYLKHPVYAHKCYQYFIDIGIPEDYERAQEEFRAFEF